MYLHAKFKFAFEMSFGAGLQHSGWQLDSECIIRDKLAVPWDAAPLCEGGC